MKQSTIVSLESKLTVYKFCYQEALKTKDLKRMIVLGPIISDLTHEIAILKE